MERDVGEIDESRPVRARWYKVVLLDARRRGRDGCRRWNVEVSACSYDIIRHGKRIEVFPCTTRGERHRRMNMEGV